MKRSESLAVTALVAFDGNSAKVQVTLSVVLCSFAVSQISNRPLFVRFGRRPVLISGLALAALFAYFVPLHRRDRRVAIS